MATASWLFLCGLKQLALSGAASARSVLAATDRRAHATSLGAESMLASSAASSRAYVFGQVSDQLPGAATHHACSADRTMCSNVQRWSGRSAGFHVPPRPPAPRPTGRSTGLRDEPSSSPTINGGAHIGHGNGVPSWTNFDLCLYTPLSALERP